MKYNLIVCGGTFDHFHKGHEEFLKCALSLGEKVLIGITSDEYLKSSKLKAQSSKLIEDYNTRKENILSFLKQERALDRIEIQPINDIYIPKVWESLPIEAIIVSENTVENAKRINLKRQEQKKYPLRIEIVALIKNNNNEYISSSKIRRGEMDREGRPYLNPLWLKHDLKITETLRGKLKKPFDTLIRDPDRLFKKLFLLSSRLPRQSLGQAARRDLFQRPLWNEIPRLARNDTFTENPYIITVGDVTTKTFNKLDLAQNISVIDFKVARQKRFSNFSELGFVGREKIIKVFNPPGYLTTDLFSSVKRLFSLLPHPIPLPRGGRLIILVDGEEDLSVLPLALGSPLGSLIFYGQPNEGIVKVEVSEETKKRAYSIVSKFSVCTRGH